MRGEGGMCVAKGVCVAKGGICVVKGGCAWQRGVCVVKGGMCATHPSEHHEDTVGQCAVGTHPTGMHSCSQFIFIEIYTALYGET